uniref:Uncharacterized protein n=1 Tax=Tanacetum cinerariifolium TaxID=118510 RepID=A0A6L2M8X8_TANCI|nr:hypothetical protein [Tanacetum cinerariifolium]
MASPNSNFRPFPSLQSLVCERLHIHHSSKYPSVSSIKATKGGSSKASTGSKIGHSKRKKESNSAMDLNPRQPPVPTPVDLEMHKEDQQATGNPTSLGVTNKDGANPQLSSAMSTFTHIKPIFLASFIIHYESVLGCDASADSTAEADPGKSASNDSLPPEQGRDEGTKNYSLNHTLVSTDLNVLVETTHSVSKGLETVLTQTNTRKRDNTIAKQFKEDKASKTIKLEDLAKPSQKHKLEHENNKVEAEVALLTAQPSFPNVEQLNELLVKSPLTKFSKILYAHDFSSSLPTKLKELPTKFNELAEDVKGLKKQVHELEIKLPGDFKEIPTKQEDFTKTVTTYVQAKLKTLDALLSLLHEALNRFAQNTNQATISQLFQRRADKEAKKNNLNKQQPESTTPIIPPMVTITTYMQSPFLQSPPKSSSQPEGEQTKEDKGKKAMSSKDDEE